MIIRCASRRAFLRVPPRSCAFAGRWRNVVSPNQRGFTQNNSDTIRPNPRRPNYAVKTKDYPVFQRFKYPDYDSIDDVSVWSEFLEAGLPPHLRLQTDSHGDALLEPIEVAQLLIAAPRAPEIAGTAGADVDLLFHLGFTQGRWNAVVWIVKRLVETFGGNGLHGGPSSGAIFPWSSQMPLSELTRNEIDLDSDSKISRPLSTSISKWRRLDHVTQDVDQELEHPERLRRDCFGQIWRSLGRMTMACADGEMKPEVLEIIAYLHHMEVMPMSIYNQRPSIDPTVIQQPPTLRLFSSRILTSLSDAAWRAHAKVIVEEAKAKGGDYASVRPEVPGQAYRVNVAGLRPEIWMELILWSCLQGGWVFEGVKILRDLSLEPPQREWRCLSWRSLASWENDNDWDRLDYLFNTRTNPDILESEPKSLTQVQRTISSEVVNAFVDAILTLTRLTLERDGLPPANVIRHIKQMKTLLDRSGLSLSTGSWDAILVRFFDQQPHVTDISKHFNNFIELSPAMGAELNSGSARNQPDYVMDPSAAVLGLFHRALLATINSGDVKAAFNLFQALQNRADSNKHHSIVDFINKQRDVRHDSGYSQDDLFTNYFSGIDYPAFDLQIPATTLASFLDLVTDAKAYDFGHWLVHSNDLDGPVIPERLYGDPALRPVLIRFAAETGDSGLLTRLISTQSDLAKPGDPTLPQNVLQSFLDSQINLKRWDAAERILQHMEMRFAFWSHVNLAHVARIMLSEYLQPSSDQPESNFTRVKCLFAEMVSGKYAKNAPKSEERTHLLVSVVAVLDSYWANFCLDLDCLRGFYKVSLPTRAFNLILEGIVNTFGTVTGRRVLGLFWPHSVRRAQRMGSVHYDDVSDSAANSSSLPSGATEERMEQPLVSSFVPFGSAEQRKRSTIRIRGDRDVVIAIYGGLRPDLMTIRTIFQKAMQELRDKPPSLEPLGFAASEADLAHEAIDESNLDLSETGMVVWAIRCLRSMQMADDDILTELETVLETNGMQRLRARIPELFESADTVEDSAASSNGESKTHVRTIRVD